jgi:hypothetical protein
LQINENQNPSDHTPDTTVADNRHRHCFNSGIRYAMASLELAAHCGRAYLCSHFYMVVHAILPMPKLQKPNSA